MIFPFFGVVLSHEKLKKLKKLPLATRTQGCWSVGRRTSQNYWGSPHSTSSLKPIPQRFGCPEGLGRLGRFRGGGGVCDQRGGSTMATTVKTLAQYTDWMKGILTVLPDARYEVKSFATDSARNNVAAYGVFHGTHTGQGGPVPPTGRRVSTDYVYVMQFEGSKIVHMNKIWNAGLALKDLGWA